MKLKICSETFYELLQCWIPQLFLFICRAPENPSKSIRFYYELLANLHFRARRTRKWRNSDNFLWTVLSIFIFHLFFIPVWFIFQNHVYIFIIWEGISFMWKMTRNFHQIFTFWDPLGKKKRFLRKDLWHALSEPKK